jgi:methyltransferase (TIGR00027 family)
MRELSPVGRTAMGAALQRIAHLLLDGEPKIFVDSLAQRLLGLSDDDVARAKAQFPLSPSLWVLRSRYTEDRLAEATARGVTQYVILGASLDTFAYRASGTVGAVRVYEVDTPESQLWKRDRLNAANIPVPPTCVFVPCNFEAQSLAEAFAESPFDRSQATFVSWLGVTQYLNRHAIVDALRWISGLGPRTELVLTYCIPEARSSPGVQYAERRGSRFVSLFSPDAMEQLLHEAYFAETRPLTLDEARATYFEGRSDGLEVEETERLIWAQVSAVRPMTA